MDRTILPQLANVYKQASGAAYAKGDDKNAEAFREAAKLLTETFEKLPTLPLVTR